MITDEHIWSNYQRITCLHTVLLLYGTYWAADVS